MVSFLDTVEVDIMQHCSLWSVESLIWTDKPYSKPEVLNYFFQCKKVVHYFIFQGCPLHLLLLIEWFFLYRYHLILTQYVSYTISTQRPHRKTVLCQGPFYCPLKRCHAQCCLLATKGCNFNKGLLSLRSSFKKHLTLYKEGMEKQYVVVYVGGLLQMLQESTFTKWNFSQGKHWKTNVDVNP